MEPQSCQQQHEDNSSSGGGGGANSKSSFLCRQSSTRWIPTTDQIRILRDLYYNSGVRSPSAEQIQKISARLRQYGKIEGKNVFYWFQNHKARERQKKKLTVETAASNKYANGMPSPGFSTTCTSSGVYGVGWIGGNGCGAGSLLMERSYMECSLSGGFGTGGQVVEGGNMGWVELEPTTALPPVYYHQQRPTFYYEQQQQQLQLLQQQQQLEDQEEEEEEEEAAEIETLPLFPVHSKPEDEEGVYSSGGRHLNSHWVGKNHHLPAGGYFPPLYVDQTVLQFPQQQQQQQHEEGNRRHHYPVFYTVGGDDGNNINHHLGGASLELSLNSYAPPPPSST